MRIKHDNVLLCDECTIAAINDDYTELDYHYEAKEAEARMADIQDGLAELGPHLVPNFDSESEDGVWEFSAHGCDCCHSRLAGRLHRFAILAND